MKLCEDQKLFAVFLILLIPIVFALASGFRVFLRDIMIEIIGGLLVAFILYWLIRRTAEIEAVVKGFEAVKAQEERRRKQEVYLNKLREDVFMPWSNISIYSDEFRIVVNMDIIDLDMFNRGKDFLKKENDETREIYRIWNQLKDLWDEYNEMGENINNKIIKYLADAYPSLKEIESRFVKPKDNCYVINEIFRFIEIILKPKILKNELIKWDKIIPNPVPYRDVSPSMWSLEPHGVHIQSNNKNDVNKKYYQNVMIGLIPTIENDLIKQSKLYEKIEQDLLEFKAKIRSLSIDIELNRI